MSETGISEDTIATVLTANKGDLIMTAEDLGMVPSKLVRYIRAVPKLAATYAAIDEAMKGDDLDAKSAAAISRAIQERTAAYRLDGLEVVHELAMAPHRNAAEAEVRLKAAIELRGKADSGAVAGNAVLAELNDLYQKSAPRIKTLRAVQIEFELPSDEAGTAGAPAHLVVGSDPDSTGSRTADAPPEA